MRCTQVTVRWRSGLHLRPAAQLIRLARGFQSEIRLRVGGTIADARSILAILLLGAGLGTALEVEASGADEPEAILAVQQFFAAAAEDGDAGPADLSTLRTDPRNEHRV
jgi:phosphotransferase system HPr (HPr) family protein